MERELRLLRLEWGEVEEALRKAKLIRGDESIIEVHIEHDGLVVKVRR